MRCGKGGGGAVLSESHAALGAPGLAFVIRGSWCERPTVRWHSDLGATTAYGNRKDPAWDPTCGSEVAEAKWKAQASGTTTETMHAAVDHTRIWWS